jgi:hypothetical protein
MSLAAGTRLGPYEVVALIGVGGWVKSAKLATPVWIVLSRSESIRLTSPLVHSLNWLEEVNAKVPAGKWHRIMADNVHFDGDPATDSARRHLERVLKEPESRRRRWPWLAASITAVAAAWYFWPRRAPVREEPREAHKTSGEVAREQRALDPPLFPPVRRRQPGPR